MAVLDQFGLVLLLPVASCKHPRPSVVTERRRHHCALVSHHLLRLALFGD